ncbi:MAG: hypothetical protein GXP39_19075 [Chloroflexi bacterium]|nr:hypothetical protein [Chloroflexota bacterium]
MKAGTGNSGGRRRPRVRVTDELLSAYIDGEVTPEEREAVEEAVARDPDVAFRLQTLQHTVSLLSNLPRASLPRAFTLSEADVAPDRREPFWRRWRGLTLSLYLRGATALAATLLVVLLVGDFWLSGQLAVGSRAPAPLERKQAVAVEEAEIPAATMETALKAESIPAQEEKGLPTQEAAPGAPPPAPLVMEKVEAPEAPPAEGQVPKGAGGEAAPEVRTLVAPPLEVPAAAEEEEPAVVARKAPPGAPQPAAPESPTAETAVAAGQPPAVAPAAPEDATATAQAGALATPTPAPPTIVATQVAAPAPATPTPVPLVKAPERAPGRGPVPEGEVSWVEGREERLFGVPIAWIRALEVILVAAVVILGVASWLTRAR